MLRVLLPICVDRNVLTRCSFWIPNLGLGRAGFGLGLGLGPLHLPFNFSGAGGWRPKFAT